MNFNQKDKHRSVIKFYQRDWHAVKQRLVFKFRQTEISSLVLSKRLA